MRKILIPIILLLWLLLGWKMCTDYTHCCTEEVVAELPAVTPPPVKTESTQPQCDDVVCFDNSDCDPIFCTNWEAFRDSIINEIGEGQKLLITGIASQSEANNSTFRSLGECRADAIRKAIEPYLNGKTVESNGILRVGKAASEITNCKKIEFKILGANAQSTSSTLIYFPYSSTNKLADSSVETYLKQVAAQVKSSGQSIRLTGHTDSQGNNESNMALGQRRANVIKAELVNMGVSPSKISATSKGETQPVANNNTEVGRAKNRRTELQIIN